MPTKAKFECVSVTKSKHWDGSGKFLHTAKLIPVVSGSEENKKFFEATPSGSIEIGQFNEESFVPGKQYYVEFTEAE